MASDVGGKLFPIVKGFDNDGKFPALNIGKGGGGSLLSSESVMLVAVWWVKRDVRLMMVAVWWLRERCA